jgi:hypothetical protein
MWPSTSGKAEKHALAIWRCCPGLPVFYRYKLPKNWETIPKDHKMYQKITKYTKRPQNMPTVNYFYQMIIKNCIAWPFKIYRNWDFWYENIPTANTDVAIHNTYVRYDISKERGHESRQDMRGYTVVVFRQKRKAD